MNTLIERFLGGEFNRIIPMNFMLLALGLALVFFCLRYGAYKYKKRKYAAYLPSGNPAATGQREKKQEHVKV